MPTVTIHHNGQTLLARVPAGSPLSQALHQAGVPLSMPCGGNHTCGKCRVWAEGGVEPPGERERALLGDEPGRRLACFARVTGDCQVRTAAAGGQQIAANYRPDELPPPPTSAAPYGAAVDIGTTTVAIYLFSRTGGTPLAVSSEVNRQRSYGADVLSRIAYCNTHTVTPLRDVIRGQLDDMLAGLCRKAGVPPEALGFLCVTGNTTMLHLLAGLEPRTLALAPFTAVSLFGDELPLPLPRFPELRAYLPRCISAYVGADITCCILASGIASRRETVLLVDIGTNGEMALRTPEGLVCTSTAAGPAFEGAGISSGMSARDGAVSSVWVQDGQVRWRTVGNAAAIGLCGSGLIDGVAALLELGVLAPSGRMDARYHGTAPLGDSGIAVTQGDVRQLQLAKGAIRGGMDALLHRCGVPYEALDRILLCGGFGSYMNVRSAQAIGLIPPGMAERTSVLGNAAGIGAGYILQNAGRRTESMRIAELAEAIDLSTDSYFKKRYVEVMKF